MNIKDSYLHGGSHVVKNIQFGIASSGNNNGKLVATITWAQEGVGNTELVIPISGATFGKQTKNTVYAAPSSANGDPSFRALVAADIPEIGAGLITSGTLGADRLPLATNTTKGAVILGVAADNTTNITGKLYWVKMNANGKIYVDVPWTNTWNANALNTAGYVAAPSSSDANKVWKTDGSGNPAWRADSNTTYTLKIGTASNANDIVTLLDGTSTTSGVIITNTAYNASSNKIATMTDVSNAVASVFLFKGDTAALPSGTQVAGWAYRVSTGFTLAAANSASGKDEVLEVGDLIVCTSATGKFLAINTNWTVTNSAPTLGTTAKTIATIGGVDITASIPAAARTSSAATAGIIALNPGTGTTKFLREDGSWQVPSIANNIYNTSRGYLYQSADSTTSCTGVGSVTAATEIGIPYIGYSGSANTYGIYKDLFYLSGTTKYIHGDVHSTKFACVKTLNSTTDDWDGSTTSGSGTGGGTTYKAGDGITISENTISTSNKEWYGTEAQFNALTSLNSNTTYYITAD